MGYGFDGDVPGRKYNSVTNLEPGRGGVMQNCMLLVGPDRSEKLLTWADGLDLGRRN